jgi:hypothetical protein
MDSAFLRDCYTWKKQGLPMNTSSNEAAKLYDVSLTQYVAFCDNSHYGGLSNSLENMLKADNEFVLGQALSNGIQLIGNSAAFTSHHSYNSMKQMNDLTEKQSEALSQRELDHVAAINRLYQGNLTDAFDLWENILIEHPTDLMAIKFAQDIYFYLGFQREMRDSVARVLPKWDPSLSNYSYLYGLLSFGLVQTNFFVEAERAAKKGLELNRKDAWATHTICHLNEYKNECDEGIRFLRETEADWSISNYIAPHNYWHMALYHIEKNEHEAALELFDHHISKYLARNTTLDMIDLCSLLYRLKLDGCTRSLKERWLKLKQVYEHRINEHGYLFNDAHLAMLLSSCGDADQTASFYSSLNNYNSNKDENSNDLLNDISEDALQINRNLKSLNGYLKKISIELSANVFDAIFHFDQGNYSNVVELLYPIRYSLIKIGGSNAQRDMFHQMLTQAALRSENKHHNKLGLALINERLCLKPNSNLTKRIAARFSQYD